MVASNFAVPLAGLNKGLHKFILRSKDANGNWSISNAQSLLIYNILSALPATTSPSLITSMEYFMDVDPGFGNATPISITAASDVTASNIAIPVSSLSNGLHRLFVRSKNANGNWSLSSSPPIFIAKLINNIAPNAVPANIVAVEYFFDTDPGFKKGTAIPLTSGADILAANVTISMGNLSKGIHRLFIRSLDANGNWSITNAQSILIYIPIGQLPANTKPLNIVAMEYFMDSDPGFGNGTSMPITTGNDVSSGSVAINITGLSKGVHHLFVRSKDEAGRWSISSIQNINIFSFIGLPSNTNSSPITAMEYFMDNDPGFGKGATIPVAAGTDVTASNVAVPISNNISAGVHRLYVRTKNANGNWSLSGLSQFFITRTIGNLPSNQAATNIVAMEYFIDSDPGFNNGTAIPISTGTDVTASNIAISISNNLSAGIHRLYIRTKNANGNWSLSSLSQFFMAKAIGNLPSNQAVANIVATEYFFDTDPGYDNGTSISINPTTDNTTSIAIPITNLSNGFHHLYIRSKNTDGNWSITNVLPVGIINLIGNLPKNVTLQNITALEYFVDTDPGYGLGTPIAITSVTDISVTNYPISLGSLSVGFHKIYVRSKNSNGNWSITNKQNLFVIGDIALPANPIAGAITKLEYFVDTDPGFGKGTQVSIPATTDVMNFNFGASLGNIADGNHRLYVRTYDTWGLTNVVSFKVGTTVLPLTWLTFTAKLLDKGAVLLTWKTAAEVNNQYFVVERSADGLQFDSIGMVLAKKLQVSSNEYNLVDDKPLNGISYYRIKQIDKDGKFTYSAVVAIRLNVFSAIHVSPNPFHNAFTVQLSASKAGDATLKLMDVNGKALVVKTVDLIAGTNTFSMENLSQLAGGTYILLVNTGVESATIKLIKD